MAGWKGMLTGALALVFFETIVQPSASKRVGSGIGALTNLATRFLDPAVPAIGAPAKKKSSGGGSGGGIPWPDPLTPWDPFHLLPKVGPIQLSTPTVAPAAGRIY